MARILLFAPIDLIPLTIHTVGCERKSDWVLLFLVCCLAMVLRTGIHTPCRGLQRINWKVPFCAIAISFEIGLRLSPRTRKLPRVLTRPQPISNRNAYVIEKIITAQKGTFPINGGNAFIQGVELSVLCKDEALLRDA